MTSLAYIPNNFQSEIVPYKNISTEIKRPKLRWIDLSERKEDLMTVSLEDNFIYSDLQELRLEFESTGLYSAEDLDRIIQTYGRLPKYKKKGSSGT